jgi:hypothetical protein
VFFLYSVFAAWQDEHKNTATVETDKAALTATANACIQDARVLQARFTGLETMVQSQRVTIDKQQLSNDFQQRDISSCVVSLGKMNPIIREKITVVSVPLGWEDSLGHFPLSLKTPIKPATPAPDVLPKRYVFELLIITNEPERKFYGNLKCDSAFNFIDPPFISPESLAGMRSPSVPRNIAPNQYELRYDATGTEWNPSHPAFMRVITQRESLGSCVFTPND